MFPGCPRSTALSTAISVAPVASQEVYGTGAQRREQHEDDEYAAHHGERAPGWRLFMCVFVSLYRFAFVSVCACVFVYVYVFM